MRLVDADALIKHLDDAIRDAIRKNEICDYWEDDRSNLLYYLDNAPTIDAVEVVRGEWRNYKDEHTCSVCKEVVIGDWYYKYEWYDFCPNCGAHMKGADDE